MADWLQAADDKTLALLHQIEANLAETWDREPPTTYTCPNCLDLGVEIEQRTSRLHDQALYAIPCERCQRGAHAKRGDAKVRIVVRKTDLARNRLLSSVEQEDAANGRYGFLEGDDA